MSFFMAGIKSAEELAKVNAGMGDDSLPTEYLSYFIFFLALVILTSVLASIIRRRWRGAMFRGWASINDNTRINAIFKRAAERRAGCTLEIFDHHHGNIYRGHVHEVRVEDQLILELSHLPGQNVDFEGFPAQIHLNFRPSPKEAMEHYKFSSHTLAINYQREKSWRVARVAIAWPNNIVSAQRRDFLRLEPLGRHSMKFGLYRLPAEMPRDIDQLELVGKGEVQDFSVGGAQLLFSDNSSVTENLQYLAVIDLSMAELDLTLKTDRFYLIFQPLSQDLINLNGESKEARTLIRGKFIGRYRQDTDTGLWLRSDFCPEGFQDLAQWINAYQRYLFKKEKYLTAIPEDRVNTRQPPPPKHSNSDN